MILTFHGKLIASGVQGSAYRYGKSLTIDFFTIFSNKNFFTILPYNIHSGNILPTPGGVRSQALKLFLVPDRAVRSWFQDRTRTSKIQKSRTGPDRRNIEISDRTRIKKIQNLGPDRIRTKNNFKTWDRTGPGLRKISKLGTRPDQDREKFQSLGPDRTRAQKKFEISDRTEPGPSKF